MGEKRGAYRNLVEIPPEIWWRYIRKFGGYTSENLVDIPQKIWWRYIGKFGGDT
jgi:hypothetical protein